jgi:hypothetical protein
VILQTSQIGERYLKQSTNSCNNGITLRIICVRR